MTPIRIQRKRTKGWLMPMNTIYVGRPSKWGNPFIPGQDNVTNKRHAFCLYRAHAPLVDNLVNMAKAELRGKNLACWCAIGDDCHADVLLEIANS